MVIGILIVGIIGLVAGLILAIASIVLAVTRDETVEALTKALPGANCGACGFSGCVGYAEAMANKKAAIGLCPPGGGGVASLSAKILGETVNEMERKVAVIMCQGHYDHVDKKFKYHGINTCQAVSQIYNGDSVCEYGCLGRGDCASICPENAIVVVNGLAVVRNALCVGCGLCINTCPKGIIEIKSEIFSQHVRCKNLNKGALTRKICPTGCLGCMKCQKVCEIGAIKVENFCASMDYEKCTDCGECAKVCPVNSIV